MIHMNSASPFLIDFDLCWDSMFINLFNFRFLRNCRKIYPSQTWTIITYKHGIYELPREMLNNVRLRIL